MYLPDHLKRALTATAAASGRSEAEVVRTAVEQAVTSSTAGSTAPEPPVRGRLVGVGVGPGDPDLLTVRALDALRRADRVLAPVTAVDAVGRAEAIVREAAPDVRVQRVPFAMTTDPDARREALDGAARAIAGHLDAGEEVAFITLGDPTIYSTFTSVAAGVRAIRPSTTVASVPGVMAFQALAARTNTVLVDERQRLVITTALDGDDVERDLDDPDRTVVVYKGGRRLPEIAAALRTRRRLDGAVVGELLGFPGERVEDLADADDAPAGYLATLIAPAVDGEAR